MCVLVSCALHRPSCLNRGARGTDTGVLPTQLINTAEEEAAAGGCAAPERHQGRKDEGRVYKLLHCIVVSLQPVTTRPRHRWNGVCELSSSLPYPVRVCVRPPSRGLPSAGPLRLRRCQPAFVPALHACKRGFTPITAMYLPILTAHTTALFFLFPPFLLLSFSHFFLLLLLHLVSSTFSLLSLSLSLFLSPFHRCARDRARLFQEFFDSLPSITTFNRFVVGTCLMRSTCVSC